MPLWDTVMIALVIGSTIQFGPTFGPPEATVRSISVWQGRSLSADVGFTPQSGHRSARWQCPLCAKSGLMHRSNLYRYSITRSARPSSGSGMASPKKFAITRLFLCRGVETLIMA
jgi:hypothetical protein